MIPFEYPSVKFTFCFYVKNAPPKKAERFIVY